MSYLTAIVVIAVVGVLMFMLGITVGYWPMARRRAATVDQIVDRAVEASNERLRETSQPIAQKTEVIAARLDDVKGAVTDIHAAARSGGTISERLNEIATTTSGLSHLLDKPTERGTWGERHVEDVLKAAGFHEGTHFHKQKPLPDGKKPDFSICLPEGLELHLDVKVPLKNYRSYTEANDKETRKGAQQAFVRNVDTMVKDLAKKGYSTHHNSVDVVVMCIPNESIFEFAHRADPKLIDKALQERVILCSVSSLFAVLAVVRQSAENFQLERKADEMLDHLRVFRQEWTRFERHLAKAEKQFGRFSTSWEELSGTRQRKLREAVSRINEIDAGEPELEKPVSTDTGAARQSDHAIEPPRQVAAG